jgi:hypothetical protein
VSASSNQHWLVSLDLFEDLIDSFVAERPNNLIEDDASGFEVQVIFGRGEVGRSGVLSWGWSAVCFGLGCLGFLFLVAEVLGN